MVQLSAYVARREPGQARVLRAEPVAHAAVLPSLPAAELLSTGLRELPWSSHLHILSRTKRPEEREFYLRMAVQQRW